METVAIITEQELSRGKFFYNWQTLQDGHIVAQGKGFEGPTLALEDFAKQSRTKQLFFTTEKKGA